MMADFEKDKDFQNSVYFNAMKELMERVLDADHGKTKVSFFPNSRTILLRFEVANLDNDVVTQLRAMGGGRLNMETYRDSEPPLVCYRVCAAVYEGSAKLWRQDTFFVEVEVEFSEAQWKALKKWKLEEDE